MDGVDAAGDSSGVRGSEHEWIAGLVLVLMVGVCLTVCFALSWYFCARSRGQVHKDKGKIEDNEQDQAPSKPRLSSRDLGVADSEESDEKKESASETEVYSDEETDYDLSVKAMANENVPLVPPHRDSAADEEL